MRIAATATFLMLLSGTAHAGGAVLIPPMRVDAGPAVSLHEGHTGGQLVAGVHWASLWPSKKTKIDVGIGIVSGSFGLDEPAPGADGTTARPIGNDGSERTIEPLSFHAGYVEVATRPSGNGWWRTWAGARIETGKASKGGEDAAMIGGALRLSAEVYLPAVGSGDDMMVAGTLAVGLYSEISWRRSEVFGNDAGASLGVSMRIPFILAAD